VLSRAPDLDLVLYPSKRREPVARLVEEQVKQIARAVASSGARFGCLPGRLRLDEEAGFQYQCWTADSSCRHPGFAYSGEPWDR
jgi:hypothetical protein